MMGDKFGSVTPQDERALLAGLRSGESKAYRELLASHGPRIRATALRLLRNEADANDVVQETFLSAFRSVGRFKGESRIGTWLHRIAVNTALMRIRSQKRRPEVDIDDVMPQFSGLGTWSEHQHPFMEMPDQAAEREEACQFVRQSIDKLPEHYREALLLKDIEEMDYPETAQALGVSINAARIRVHRARQAMRGLLAPHFGEKAG